MLRSVTALAFSLALVSGAASAESAGWQGERYNIVVRDQDLREVLVQFGSLVGVPVVISDDVNGSVSARFEEASGEDIIAALAREFALDWRYDGRRIEVSSNAEQVSRILDMGGVKRAALIDALEALGAHEPRYPVTAVDGQLGLIVGPPRYVGIVEIVLAELVEKKISDDEVAMQRRMDAEAKRLAEVERLRALEVMRLEAMMAAQARQGSSPARPAERATPLINRGGRWGG
jgi:type II secretory pathway component GspD/PulD (secretin)